MEIKEYSAMFNTEETHFWYKGMRRITKSLLDRFLDKKGGNMVLDAGCGTGGSFPLLKSYGTPHGIDISKVAIKYCRNRGLKNVRIGNVDKIPFKSESFDLVTSFDVLYHKKVKNDISAINEFYRVLKPGGVLVVRVPAYNWFYSYHDKQVHTRHRYTIKEIKSIISAPQFKILKASYINFFLFPLIGFKRLLHKSRRNTSDVSAVFPPVNTLFYLFFVIESFLIQYIPFPFGLSIVVVAKKQNHLN